MAIATEMINFSAMLDAAVTLDENGKTVIDNKALVSAQNKLYIARSLVYRGSDGQFRLIGREKLEADEINDLILTEADAAIMEIASSMVNFTAALDDAITINPANGEAIVDEAKLTVAYNKLYIARTLVYVDSKGDFRLIGNQEFGQDEENDFVLKDITLAEGDRAFVAVDQDMTEFIEALESAISVDEEGKIVIDEDAQYVMFGQLHSAISQVRFGIAEDGEDTSKLYRVSDIDIDPKLKEADLAFAELLKEFEGHEELAAFVFGKDLDETDVNELGNLLNWMGLVAYTDADGVLRVKQTKPGVAQSIEASQWISNMEDILALQDADGNYLIRDLALPEMTEDANRVLFGWAMMAVYHENADGSQDLYLNFSESTDPAVVAFLQALTELTGLIPADHIMAQSAEEYSNPDFAPAGFWVDPENSEIKHIKAEQLLHYMIKVFDSEGFQALYKDYLTYTKVTDVPDTEEEARVAARSVETIEGIDSVLGLLTHGDSDLVARFYYLAAYAYEMEQSWPTGVTSIEQIMQQINIASSALEEYTRIKHDFDLDLTRGDDLGMLLYLAKRAQEVPHLRDRGELFYEEPEASLEFVAEAFYGEHYRKMKQRAEAQRATLRVELEELMQRNEEGLVLLYLRLLDVYARMDALGYSPHSWEGVDGVDLADLPSVIDGIIAMHENQNDEAVQMLRIKETEEQISANRRGGHSINVTGLYHLLGSRQEWIPNWREKAVDNRNTVQQIYDRSFTVPGGSVPLALLQDLVDAINSQGSVASVPQATNLAVPTFFEGMIFPEDMTNEQKIMAIQLELERAQISAILAQQYGLGTETMFRIPSDMTQQDVVGSFTGESDQNYIATLEALSLARVESAFVNLPPEYRWDVGFKISADLIERNNYAQVSSNLELYNGENKDRKEAAFQRAQIAVVMHRSLLVQIVEYQDRVKGLYLLALSEAKTTEEKVTLYGELVDSLEEQQPVNYNELRIARVELDLARADHQKTITNLYNAEIALSKWNVDKSELEGENLNSPLIDIRIMLGVPFENFDDIRNALDLPTLIGIAEDLRLDSMPLAIQATKLEGKAYANRDFLVQLHWIYRVSELLPLEQYGDGELARLMLSLEIPGYDPTRGHRRNAAYFATVLSQMDYGLAQNEVTQEVTNAYNDFAMAVEALKAAQQKKDLADTALLHETDPNYTIQKRIDVQNAESDLARSKALVYSAWLNLLSTMGMPSRAIPTELATPELNSATVLEHMDNKTSLDEAVRTEADAEPAVTSLTVEDLAGFNIDIKIIVPSSGRNFQYELTYGDTVIEPTYEYTSDGKKLIRAYYDINGREYQILFDKGRNKEIVITDVQTGIAIGFVAEPSVTEDGVTEDGVYVGSSWLGGILNDVNEADMYTFLGIQRKEEGSAISGSGSAIPIGIKIEMFKHGEWSVLLVPDKYKHISGAALVVRELIQGTMDPTLGVLTLYSLFKGHQKARSQRAFRLEQNKIRVEQAQMQAQRADFQGAMNLRTAEEEVNQKLDAIGDASVRVEELENRVEYYLELGDERPESLLVQAQKDLIDAKLDYVMANMEYEQAQQNYIIAFMNANGQIPTDQELSEIAPVGLSDEQIDAIAEIAIAEANLSLTFSSLLDKWDAGISTEAGQDFALRGMSRIWGRMNMPLVGFSSTSLQSMSDMGLNPLLAKQYALEGAQIDVMYQLYDAATKYWWAQMIVEIHKNAQEDNQQMQANVGALADHGQVMDQDPELLESFIDSQEVQLKQAKQDLDNLMNELKRVSAELGRPIPKDLLEKLLYITDLSGDLSWLPGEIPVTSPELEEAKLNLQQTIAEARLTGNRTNIIIPFGYNSFTNRYQLQIGIEFTVDNTNKTMIHKLKVYDAQKQEISIEAQTEKTQLAIYNLLLELQGQSMILELKKENLQQAAQDLEEKRNGYIDGVNDINALISSYSEYKNRVTDYLNTMQKYNSAELQLKKSLKKAGVDVGGLPQAFVMPETEVEPEAVITEEVFEEEVEEPSRVKSLWQGAVKRFRKAFLKVERPLEETPASISGQIPVPTFLGALFNVPELTEEELTLHKIYAANPKYDNNKLISFDLYRMQEPGNPDSGVLFSSIDARYDTYTDNAGNEKMVSYYTWNPVEGEQRISVYRGDIEFAYQGNRYVQPDVTMEYDAARGKYVILSVNAEEDRGDYTIQLTGEINGEVESLGTVEITGGEVNIDLNAAYAVRNETVDVLEKVIVNTDLQRVIVSGRKINRNNEDVGTVVIVKNLDHITIEAFSFSKGVMYMTKGEAKQATAAFTYDSGLTQDQLLAEVLKNGSDRQVFTLSQIFIRDAKGKLLAEINLTDGKYIKYTTYDDMGPYIRIVGDEYELKNIAKVRKMLNIRGTEFSVPTEKDEKKLKGDATGKKIDGYQVKGASYIALVKDSDGKIIEWHETLSDGTTYIWGKTSGFSMSEYRSLDIPKALFEKAKASGNMDDMPDLLEKVVYTNIIEGKKWQLVLDFTADWLDEDGKFVSKGTVTLIRPGDNVDTGGDVTVDGTDYNIYKVNQQMWQLDLSKIRLYEAVDIDELGTAEKIIEGYAVKDKKEDDPIQLFQEKDEGVIANVGKTDYILKDEQTMVNAEGELSDALAVVLINKFQPYKIAVDKADEFKDVEDSIVEKVVYTNIIEGKKWQLVLDFTAEFIHKDGTKTKGTVTLLQPATDKKVGDVTVNDEPHDIYKVRQTVWPLDLENHGEDYRKFATDEIDTSKKLEDYKEELGLHKNVIGYDVRDSGGKKIQYFGEDRENGKGVTANVGKTDYILKDEQTMVNAEGELSDALAVVLINKFQPYKIAIDKADEFSDVKDSIVEKVVYTNIIEGKKWQLVLDFTAEFIHKDGTKTKGTVTLLQPATDKKVGDVTVNDEPHDIYKVRQTVWPLDLENHGEDYRKFATDEIDTSKKLEDYKEELGLHKNVIGYDVRDSGGKKIQYFGEDRENGKGVTANVGKTDYILKDEQTMVNAEGELSDALAVVLINKFQPYKIAIDKADEFSDVKDSIVEKVVYTNIIEGKKWQLVLDFTAEFIHKDGTKTKGTVTLLQPATDKKVGDVTVNDEPHDIYKVRQTVWPLDLENHGEDYRKFATDEIDTSKKLEDYKEELGLHKNVIGYDVRDSGGKKIQYFGEDRENGKGVTANVGKTDYILKDEQTMVNAEGELSDALAVVLINKFQPYKIAIDKADEFSDVKDSIVEKVVYTNIIEGKKWQLVLDFTAEFIHKDGTKTKGTVTLLQPATDKKVGDVTVNDEPHDIYKVRQTVWPLDLENHGEDYRKFATDEIDTSKKLEDYKEELGLHKNVIGYDVRDSGGKKIQYFGEDRENGKGVTANVGKTDYILKDEQTMVNAEGELSDALAVVLINKFQPYKIAVDKADEFSDVKDSIVEKVVYTNIIEGKKWQLVLDFTAEFIHKDGTKTKGTVTLLQPATDKKVGDVTVNDEPHDIYKVRQTVWPLDLENHGEDYRKFATDEIDTSKKLEDYKEELGLHKNVIGYDVRDSGGKKIQYFGEDRENGKGVTANVGKTDYILKDEQTMVNAEGELSDALAVVLINKFQPYKIAIDKADEFSDVKDSIVEKVVYTNIIEGKKWQLVLDFTAEFIHKDGTKTKGTVTLLQPATDKKVGDVTVNDEPHDIYKVRQTVWPLDLENHGEDYRKFATDEIDTSKKLEDYKEELGLHKNVIGYDVRDSGGKKIQYFGEDRENGKGVTANVGKTDYILKDEQTMVNAEGELSDVLAVVLINKFQPYKIAVDKADEFSDVKDSIVEKVVYSKMVMVGEEEQKWQLVLDFTADWDDENGNFVSKGTVTLVKPGSKNFFANTRSGNNVYEVQYDMWALDLGEHADHYREFNEKALGEAREIKGYEVFEVIGDKEKGKISSYIQVEEDGKLKGYNYVPADVKHAKWLWRGKFKMGWESINVQQMLANEEVPEDLVEVYIRHEGHVLKSGAVVNLMFTIKAKAAAVKDGTKLGLYAENMDNKSISYKGTAFWSPSDFRLEGIDLTHKFELVKLVDDGNYRVDESTWDGMKNDWSFSKHSWKLGDTDQRVTINNYLKKRYPEATITEEIRTMVFNAAVASHQEKELEGYQEKKGPRGLVQRIIDWLRRVLVSWGILKPKKTREEKIEELKVTTISKRDLKDVLNDGDKIDGIVSDRLIENIYEKYNLYEELGITKEEIRTRLKNIEAREGQSVLEIAIWHASKDSTSRHILIGPMELLMVTDKLFDLKDSKKIQASILLEVERSAEDLFSGLVGNYLYRGSGKTVESFLAEKIYAEAANLAKYMQSAGDGYDPQIVEAWSNIIYAYYRAYENVVDEAMVEEGNNYQGKVDLILQMRSALLSKLGSENIITLDNLINPGYSYIPLYTNNNAEVRLSGANTESLPVSYTYNVPQANRDMTNSYAQAFFQIDNHNRTSMHVIMTDIKGNTKKLIRQVDPDIFYSYPEYGAAKTYGAVFVPVARNASYDDVENFDSTQVESITFEMIHKEGTEQPVDKTARGIIKFVAIRQADTEFEALQGPRQELTINLDDKDSIGGLELMKQLPYAPVSENGLGFWWLLDGQDLSNKEITVRGKVNIGLINKEEGVWIVFADKKTQEQVELKAEVDSEGNYSLITTLDSYSGFHASNVEAIGVKFYPSEKTLNPLWGMGLALIILVLSLGGFYRRQKSIYNKWLIERAPIGEDGKELLISLLLYRAKKERQENVDNFIGEFEKEIKKAQDKDKKIAAEDFQKVINEFERKVEEASKYFNPRLKGKDKTKFQEKNHVGWGSEVISWFFARNRKEGEDIISKKLSGEETKDLNKKMRDICADLILAGRVDIDEETIKTQYDMDKETIKTQYGEKEEGLQESFEKARKARDDKPDMVEKSKTEVEEHFKAFDEADAKRRRRILANTVNESRLAVRDWFDDLGVDFRRIGSQQEERGIFQPFMRRSEIWESDDPMAKPRFPLSNILTGSVMVLVAGIISLLGDWSLFLTTVYPLLMFIYAGSILRPGKSFQNTFLPSAGFSLLQTLLYFNPVAGISAQAVSIVFSSLFLAIYMGAPFYKFHKAIKNPKTYRDEQKKRLEVIKSIVTIIQQGDDSLKFAAAKIAANESKDGKVQEGEIRELINDNTLHLSEDAQNYLEARIGKLKNKPREKVVDTLWGMAMAHEVISQEYYRTTRSYGAEGETEIDGIKDVEGAKWPGGAVEAIPNFAETLEETLKQVDKKMSKAEDKKGEVSKTRIAMLTGLWTVLGPMLLVLGVGLVVVGVGSIIVGVWNFAVPFILGKMGLSALALGQIGIPAFISNISVPAVSPAFGIGIVIAAILAVYILYIKLYEKEAYRTMLMGPVSDQSKIFIDSFRVIYDLDTGEELQAGNVWRDLTEIGAAISLAIEDIDYILDKTGPVLEQIQKREDALVKALKHLNEGDKEYSQVKYQLENLRKLKEKEQKRQEIAQEEGIRGAIQKQLNGVRRGLENVRDSAIVRGPFDSFHLSTGSRLMLLIKAVGGILIIGLLLQIASLTGMWALGQVSSLVTTGAIASFSEIFPRGFAIVDLLFMPGATEKLGEILLYFISQMVVFGTIVWMGFWLAMSKFGFYLLGNNARLFPQEEVITKEHIYGTIFGFIVSTVGYVFIPVLKYTAIPVLSSPLITVALSTVATIAMAAYAIKFVTYRKVQNRFRGIAEDDKLLDENSKKFRETKLTDGQFEQMKRLSERKFEETVLGRYDTDEIRVILEANENGLKSKNLSDQDRRLYKRILGEGVDPSREKYGIEVSREHKGDYTVDNKTRGELQKVIEERYENLTKEQILGINSGTTPRISPNIRNFSLPISKSLL